MYIHVTNKGIDKGTCRLIFQPLVLKIIIGKIIYYKITVFITYQLLQIYIWIMQVVSQMNNASQLFSFSYYYFVFG